MVSPVRGLLFLSFALVFAAGCGGANEGRHVRPPVSSLLAPAEPTVEIRSANRAFLGTEEVAYDGLDQGLAWPALERAVAKSSMSKPVVQVARDVPIQTVLRAVFSLRGGNVRLQTPDERGVMRAVELKAKPSTEAPTGRSACHVAVFVKSDGSFRLASRAGPKDLAPPDNDKALVDLLSAENEACPLRYVAFGGESNDALWGAVFDVLFAVERERAAGDARYVLGEAMKGAE